MNQLQPISTAPKDQFILVRCPSGCSTTPFVFTTGVMHSDYKAGRWVDHADDDLTDWGMEPTHWMSLPDGDTAPTTAPAPVAQPNIDQRIAAIAADRDYWREQASAAPAPVAQPADEQARAGIRDGLSMALALVELYGMKGDVIHTEIAKLRDQGVAAMPAAPAPVALTPAQRHADELLAALQLCAVLVVGRNRQGDAAIKAAREVIAKIEAAGHDAAFAPVPQPLTDEQIAQIAVEVVDTLPDEELDTPTEWVFSGAGLAAVVRPCMDRAAPAPVAQPLTDEQIRLAVGASEEFWSTSALWIKSVARAIERAHKIGGPL